jgi:UPF0755 protein
MHPIRFTAFLIGGFLLTMLFVGLTFLFLLSPKHFETEREVLVSRGEHLRDISRALEEAGVIRSAAAFHVLVLLQGGERSVVAGIYRFTEPESARAITKRLLSGDFRSDSLVITFPEGLVVREMALLLAERIPNFDTASFLSQALPLEGYLFPDTYFFHNNATPEEIIATMKANFERRTAAIPIAPRLADRPFSDILIMASLLEEEAATTDSRRIVSGILWSRIEKEMPLQVDAAFLYIEELEGRNTYTLTLEDLAFDSPYNTYINVGFPPTPITNPGLDSILAAANPIASDYLFYLSDTRGNMYYARTFEEHRENRKFLDD